MMTNEVNYQNKIQQLQEEHKLTIKQLEEKHRNIVWQLEKQHLDKVQQLRKDVGSWRRLAQEKGPRSEYLRDGYDYNRELHYKVYVIKDVPQDLPMKAVLEELKLSFLPSVLPYRFDRCDRSKKYNGWLVQVVAHMYTPMEVLTIVSDKSGAHRQ